LAVGIRLFLSFLLSADFLDIQHRTSYTSPHKRKFLSKIVKELSLLHSIFLASAYLTNQGADKNRSWYADRVDEASGNLGNNKDKNKEL
jgi:hypothetical protein